jgi:hypothetical protein
MSDAFRTGLKAGKVAGRWAGGTVATLVIGYVIKEVWDEAKKRIHTKDEITVRPYNYFY